MNHSLSRIPAGLILAALLSALAPAQPLSDGLPEGSQAGGRFGSAIAAADLDGDGFTDLLVGASHHDINGLANAGAVFVHPGSAGGFSPFPTQVLAGLQAGALFGASLAILEDFNGDGFRDILVGAPLHDIPGFIQLTDGGTAFLFHGSPAGFFQESPMTLRLTTTGGANSQFGASVASAGDFNGDGFTDAVVGAPLFDTGGSGGADAGGAYIYFGGPPETFYLDLPDVTFTGNTLNSTMPAKAGSCVASAGNLNGDINPETGLPLDDVVIGAPFQSRGHIREGAFIVLYGRGGGSVPVANQIVESNAIGQSMGASVAGAGDFDGDGVPDLIVGAPEAFGAQGIVYLYRGQQGSTLAVPAALHFSNSHDNSWRFGGTVMSAGDFNGDGHPDVVVGEARFGADEGAMADAGALHVFAGGPDTLPNAAPILTVEGDQAGTLLGGVVHAAGDLNGDNHPDLICGLPGYDLSPTLVDAGRLLLVAGINCPPSSPDAIEQLLADEITPLDAGGTANRSAFAVKARISDRGRDRVRLQVEVKPAGIPFTGRGSGIATGELLASGSVNTVVVDGLPSDVPFHWHVRTVDAEGDGSLWISFGSHPDDPDEVDFRTKVNALPTLHSPGQHRTFDGSAIPVGQRIYDGTEVEFRAVVADEDDALLQIEVQVVALGLPFSVDAPALFSDWTPGGEPAAVRGIFPEGAYHWRVRPHDGFGAGPWITFGDNSESSGDFELRPRGGSGNPLTCAVQAGGRADAWLPVVIVTAMLAGAFRRKHVLKAVLLALMAGEASAQTGPDTWSDRSWLPQRVGNGGALLATDSDTLHLLCGGSSREFYRYRASTDVWTPLERCPRFVSSSLVTHVPGSPFIYLLCEEYLYRFDTSAPSEAWRTMSTDSVQPELMVAMAGTPAGIYAATPYYSPETDDQEEEVGVALFKFRPDGAVGEWTVIPPALVGTQPVIDVELAYPGDGEFLYMSALAGGAWRFMRCSIHQDENAPPAMVDLPSMPGLLQRLAPGRTPNELFAVHTEPVEPRSWLSLYLIEEGRWEPLLHPASGSPQHPLPALLNSQGGAVACLPGGDDLHIAVGANTLHSIRYSIPEDRLLSPVLSPAPAVIRRGSALAGIGTGDDLFAFAGELSRKFWRYSVSEDRWSEKAQTPEFVLNAASLVHAGNGRLFALRGETSPLFWRYDPDPDGGPGAWVERRNLHVPAGSMNRLVWTGGDHVYLLMRQGSELWMMRYTISDDQWTSAPLSTMSNVSFWGAEVGFVYPGSGDLLYFLPPHGNLGCYSIAYDEWNVRDEDGEAVVFDPSNLDPSINPVSLVWPDRGNVLYATTATGATWAYSMEHDRWSPLESMPTTPGPGHGVAFAGAASSHLFALAGSPTSFLWRYELPPDAPLPPESLVQLPLAGDDPIPPGGNVPEGGLRLRGQVLHGDLDPAHLEVEILPPGGAPAILLRSETSGPPGTTFTFTALGLPPGPHQWRARTADTTGRNSPWREFEAPGADFVIDTPANSPPSPPALGPVEPVEGQFFLDGQTAIPIGGATEEDGIFIHGVSIDPQSHLWTLEVDIRRVDEPFLDPPARVYASGLTASGERARVVIDDLPNGHYHWRARSADTSGLRSAWRSFGGNDDGAPPAILAEADLLLESGESNLSPNRPESLTHHPVTGASFTATALLIDPNGDDVRLQIEVTPAGAAAPLTATGAEVPSGGSATVTLAGLRPDTMHGWRARTVDSGGRLSIWVTPAAAFRTSANWAPAVHSIEQVNAVTGGRLTPGEVLFQHRRVTFRAVTEDLDLDTRRLLIEVRPLNVAFSGSPTASSPAVGPGEIASVAVTFPDDAWHWRYVVTDASGFDDPTRRNDWMEFGDAGADFIVGTQAGSNSARRCAGSAAGSSVTMTWLAVIVALSAIRKKNPAWILVAVLAAREAAAQTGPGTWSQSPGLTHRIRDGGDAVAVGPDALYLTCGDDAGAFYREDVGTRTWTRLADVPASVRTGGSLTHPPGTRHLYVTVGGYNQSHAFFRYDLDAPESGWAPMEPTPPSQDHSTSITATASAIYALNGNGAGFSPVLKLYRFLPDDGDGTWEEMATVPNHISDGTRCTIAAPDDEVLYVATDGVLWRYSALLPTQDRWETLKPPEGVIQDLIAGPPGYLCAIVSNRLLQYDIDADEWDDMTGGADEPLGLPATCRAGAALARFDGGSLVVTLGGSTTHVAHFVPDQGPHPLPPPFPSGVPGLSEGGSMTGAGGNELYVLQGGNTREFWTYSPAQDAWQRKAHTFEPVHSGSAIVHAGGRTLFAVRGSGSTQFWRYTIDPAGGSGLWNEMNPVPHVISSSAHLAWTGGDFLHLFYNYRPPAGAPRTYMARYTISRDFWEIRSQAPEACGPGASMAWPGGPLFYILKGGNTKTVWAYAPAQNRWTNPNAGGQNPLFDPADCPSRINEGAFFAHAGNRNVLFAFSGNVAVDPAGTHRLWQYVVAHDRWEELAGAPSTPALGACLASPSGGHPYLYALAGGGSSYFWRYEMPLVMPEAPAAVDLILLDESGPVDPAVPITDPGLKFRATCNHPHLDDVRLEIQVASAGVSFTDALTFESALVPSGSTITVTALGLAGNLQWRARTVDAWNRSSGWTGPDGSDAHFTIATPVNAAPGTLSDFGQFRADGFTPIPAGSTISDATLVFAAITDDPQGNVWRLEIEVKPADEGFDGSDTLLSEFTASGARAAIAFGPPEGAFHWRGRAIDSSNLPSEEWSVFGANGDGPPADPDFLIDRSASNLPPLPPQDLVQVTLDGMIVIPEGGTTVETGFIAMGRFIDPEGEAVRLQIEVRRLDEPFGGYPTATGDLIDDPSLAATATALGLVAGRSYHWRARTVDAGLRASTWVHFGTVPEPPAQADITVTAVSESGAPADQHRPDGSALPFGGRLGADRSVLFQAAVRAPDGRPRRLEVEVRPLGVEFSGSATLLSPLVEDGEAAPVLATFDRGGYHWQSRIAGDSPFILATAWTPAGGNPESWADFEIVDEFQPPDPPRGCGGACAGIGGSSGLLTLLLLRFCRRR